MHAHGYGFILLSRKDKELNDIVKKTKDELSKKVYYSEFKEKVKKNKKKLKGLVSYMEYFFEF